MRTYIVICFILLGFTHASVLVARDCNDEGNSGEVSEGSEYGSSGRCGFTRRTRGILDGIREAFNGILDKVRSGFRTLKKAGSNLIARLVGKHENPSNTISDDNKPRDFKFKHTPNTEKGRYSPSDDENYENGAGYGSGSGGGSDSNDNIDNAGSEGHEASRSEGYGVIGSGNKGLSVDLSFTGLEGSGDGRDGHGTSMHTKGKSNGENSSSTIEVNGSVGHVNSSNGSYPIEVFDEIRTIFSTVLGNDGSTAGESLITESGAEDATLIDIRSGVSKSSTFAINGTFNSIKNSGGEYNSRLENNNPEGDRGSDRRHYSDSENAYISNEHRDRGQTVRQEHMTINESRISINRSEYNKSHSGSLDSGGDFLASGGYGSSGYISNLGGGLRRISGDGGSGLNSEFTFSDQFGSSGSVGSEFGGISYSDSSLRGSGVVYGDSTVSNPHGSGEHGGSSVGTSNFGCRCRNSGSSGLEGYGPIGWSSGGFKGRSEGNLGGVFGVIIGSPRLPPLPISMSTGALGIITGDNTATSGILQKDFDTTRITGLVGNPTSRSDASSHVSWYGAIGEQRYSKGVGAVGGFNSHNSSIGTEHGVRPNEAIGLLVGQGKGAISFNSYQGSGDGSVSENTRRNEDGKSQDNYGGSVDGDGGGHRSRNSYGDSNDGNGRDLSSKGSYGDGGFGFSGGRAKSQTDSTSSNIDYRGSVGGNIGGFFSGGSSRDSGSNGQNGGDYSGGLNSYSGYIGFGERLASGLSGGSGGTRGYGSASSYSTYAVHNSEPFNNVGATAGLGGFNGFGDSVKGTPLYSLYYWPQLAQPANDRRSSMFSLA